MLGAKTIAAAALSALVASASAMTIGGRPDQMIKPYKRAPLQDIVTWDNSSIFVHGERVLFYSGEFHPYRLPVPGLWLDVLQKIKSLGYSGVSFYTDWALLEGKQGVFNSSGIFDLQPFFDAASEAGLYLLARPGPYINAESSGGGYPGWLQRNPGILRTADPNYLNATNNYVKSISEIVAAAQITNGGPVILVQPENEYSQAVSGIEFPNPTYFGYVEDQYRDAGIIVPFLSNDAFPHGYFAPGQPSAVDVYGHDGYPLGFDCANPYTWPDNDLPTYYLTLHREQSPSTPYAITEFQGGSFDPWGGLGFAQCAELLNQEFERVFYKNDFSFGMTIFNIYMTYGGTNWGNLGHPGGYTSYDYGAVITEDRLVTREKYSEAKLEANFLRASTAFLTAVSQNNAASANGSFADTTDIAVTQLLGSGDPTNFYVIRHAAYNSLASTNYTITVPTSEGTITIPQLGGSLVLNGRDSKWHVTDYDVGGTNLLYSSAEIFTWKKYSDKTVIVVYGGPDEHHELAFSSCAEAQLIEGCDVTISQNSSTAILAFESSTDRRIVQLENNVYVYIVDRNSAYNYWVLDMPANAVPTANTTGSDAAIVNGGYLMRNISVSGSTVALVGDLNATTTIEIIGGVPDNVSCLKLNGQDLNFTQSSTGVVVATAQYSIPAFSIPDLSTIGWKTIDSLPEIQPTYDDSLWTTADLTYSNNTARNLTTYVSLYSSDYGYNTGNLLYRGHFVSNGAESSFYLSSQGGSAYGVSVWLNCTFLGSYPGIDANSNSNITLALPKLVSGSNYVITALIDNMGLDENGRAGSSEMKNPRGILDYTLSGRPGSDITWKLTGNLHGEDYEDRTRGPLNEGGLYAERQGWHLPGAPTSNWTDSALGPMAGTTQPGVQFYSTTFELDMPIGYDIPIAVSFVNQTTTLVNGTVTPYRAQLYVNGYQYGKYVHNIGPQDVFPVPTGIWNYHGSNYLAVSLWALENGGAQIGNLSLVAGPVIQSGYGEVELSYLTGWTQREGAY